MIIYRALAAMLWLAVVVAILSVIVAAALVLILGAVVYWILSPSRSPASCLRSLAANAEAGIAQVRALRGAEQETV